MHSIPLNTAFSLLGGMPMIVLSDPTSLRFQAISFFLLLIVLSSLVIWGAWNWLRRDFTFLPKLSFRGAAGITMLWGLLFVIVLTMISGARELMTPGAWKPNGLSYQLSDEQAAKVESSEVIAVRREEEIKLWNAVLKYYQAQHQGNPPPDRATLTATAQELGMSALAAGLEDNYWYDPSREKSSPIRLRQIAPHDGPSWAVTAGGVVVSLDDSFDAEKENAVSPKKKKSTSEPDDS